MTTPFIIYALPRSRTAWLSRFLSYRKWICHHQAAITMRTMSDVVTFFSQPCTGAAETAASPGWRILRHHFPNMNIIVVNRSINDVFLSMISVETYGIFGYDRDILMRGLERESRDLRRISQESDVLTVDFDALNNIDTCAEVFERCLPYRFDEVWWRRLKDRNIQADVPSVMRYYMMNFNAIGDFKKACKAELWRLARSGASM